MTPLHTSPLARELDAAREDGADEVHAQATRRHPTVRATRLPDAEVSPREAAFRRAIAEMFTDRDIEGER